MLTSGDSQFFQVQNTKLEVIRKHLDGDSQNEKLVAMKKLVAVCTTNQC
jgi:hypothetical protein